MLDQAHAQFRDDALTYAETARRVLERRPEPQAGADMTALIRDQLGDRPVLLAAILASAVIELAKAGIRPEWAVSDVD
jgi:hypothetical protein